MQQLRQWAVVVEARETGSEEVDSKSRLVTQKQYLPHNKTMFLGIRRALLLLSSASAAGGGVVAPSREQRHPRLYANCVHVECAGGSVHTHIAARETSTSILPAVHTELEKIEAPQQLTSISTTHSTCAALGSSVRTRQGAALLRLPASFGPTKSGGGPVLLPCPSSQPPPSLAKGIVIPHAPNPIKHPEHCEQ